METYSNENTIFTSCLIYSICKFTRIKQKKKKKKDYLLTENQLISLIKP